MFDPRAWLLSPIHRHLAILKVLIMEALDTLNSKVDALAVSAQAVGPALADLKSQIASLQAAGGATPADLDAVSAKVDAIKTTIDLSVAPPPVLNGPIA